MPGSPQSDPPEDFNQAPPLGDVDLLAIDWPLQEAVAANGAGAEAQASFGMSDLSQDEAAMLLARVLPD